MERKLIKQGNGGFTLYLPKKWIKKNNIQAGSNIKIFEQENGLFITDPNTKKKEINISYKKEISLKLFLTHLCRLGFEKIKITNLEKKDIEDLDFIIKNFLLGFNFTNKTDNSCVIENLNEPQNENFDNIMYKIFCITKEIHENVNHDLTKGKYSNKIEKLVYEHDKYLLYCKRILYKGRYNKDPILEWELLTFLMHISHSYYYLHKYAKSKKYIASKSVKLLLIKLKDYLNNLYESFLKKDEELIFKINSLKNELHFGELYELLKKSEGDETIIISHIRETFRLINISGSPILSMITMNKISRLF